MILSLASGAAAPSAGSGWALGLPSLVALLAYGVAVAIRGCVRRQLARRAADRAGCAHALAIVVDIAGIGSEIVAARFGFAPALSMTIWLVLAVYIIESRYVPLPGVRRSLAALGVLVVGLAWMFPGEVRPLVDSRWAPVHWVLGIASYGLFGAAVLHAAMLGRAEKQMRPPSGLAGAPGAAGVGSGAARGMPLLQLERLTFRFVGAGFVVLTAAIVLGAGFAHPWRWDHKTVFSILGWIVFAGLLAGRQAFGWRGPAATRMVYAGAGLLLLAYVGSRFVLEVLLHRSLT